ncbi:MAG: hypothetical protein IPO60_11780 [Flavobacteriales bacterium]|nr:hypothetical protein [Flavobacteriales bacterium]
MRKSWKWARSVAAIEKYYGELKGHCCPMDLEWAVDGLTKELFIPSGAPGDPHSNKATDRVVEYMIDKPGASRRSRAASPSATALEAARSASSSASTGAAATATGKDFQKGDVLHRYDRPGLEPITGKKASAIITNKGGRTSARPRRGARNGRARHRGCGNITDLLDTGMEVTASCCEGDTGIIYQCIISKYC